jgi:beta-galactosidase/beta-glucuronidase
MKAIVLGFLVAVNVLATLAAGHSADRISLAGTWRFALDRANTGVETKWFERSLPQKIKLPGSLPAQGVGDDISVETKWTGDIVDKSWFTAPGAVSPAGEYQSAVLAAAAKVLHWRGVVSARH